MANNKNITNNLSQNFSSTNLSSSAGEDERNKQAQSEFVNTCSDISPNEGQEKQKEHPRQDLKINMKEIIKKATMRHLSSDHCCIYRVSQRLRQENENAYTPRTVSIGPLHHGDEKLKAMEEVKLRYLEQFLRRAADVNKLSREEGTACNRKTVDNQIRNDFSRLDEFLGILKSLEERIRQSYAEDLSHLNEELLKIILVDAAFIIELSLKSYFESKKGTILTDKKNEDTILSTTFMLISIKMDLLLLENQVPFFVLDKLYAAAFGYYGMTNYPPRFLEVACEFFRYYNMQGQKKIETEIKHFTDLLRTFYLPIPKAEDKRSNAGAPEENNSVGILKTSTGLLRCWGLLSKPEDQKQPSYKRLYLKETLKSATQLDAAGVKFHVSSSKCLLDINFSNPKLGIPCLHLYDDSEVLFRNLMALEQYHYPTQTLFCDYDALMDYLIDTREDAGLLVEKKIILNRLGSNKKVATLFNKLCTNIVRGYINERYNCLIHTLNVYHDKKWHVWKANFRRQYCSTPWKTASVSAAVILLLLTLAQTILTIFTL